PHLSIVTPYCALEPSPHMDPLNIILSKFFGYMSIGTWVIVFIPQLYENYQRKSAESLSIHFLLFWIVGDIFNLLGSIYQEVLFTTVLLAVYFVFFDILIIAQCVYYYRSSKNDEPQVAPGKTVGSDPLRPTESSPLLSSDGMTGPSSSRCSTIVNVQGDDGETASAPQAASPAQGLLGEARQRMMLLVPLVMFNLGVLSYNQWMQPLSDAGSGWPLGVSPLMMLSTPTPSDPPAQHFKLFPQLCAWTSVVLYISARVPQIVKNFRAKSCEGLALTMFMLCVFGNSTFCLSILCYSLAPEHILVNLPWILGSGGTLIFDFIIFYQFYAYTPKAQPAEESSVSDANTICEA
ncbi:putative vacuolar membrane transporter for cationic amino acids, partial [Dispira parvispora]